MFYAGLGIYSSHEPLRVNTRLSMCSSNSKENTPFEPTIELYVRIVNACIQRCGHQSMNITSNAMVHANDFMFLFMFNSTSH